MAGTISQGRAKGSGIVSINVTPMVDILLVLLVILMATASYIVVRSMPLDLPVADSGEGTPPPLAAVTIAADGALSFNEEPVTEVSLQTRLQDLRSESEAALVVINADRAAQHGMVVHVLDMARLARLSRFSIQVVRDE
jgi:biopolymer transport protein ExbD